MNRITYGTADVAKKNSGNPYWVVASFNADTVHDAYLKAAEFVRGDDSLEIKFWGTTTRDESKSLPNDYYSG